MASPESRPARFKNIGNTLMRSFAAAVVVGCSSGVEPKVNNTFPEERHEKLNVSNGEAYISRIEGMNFLIVDNEGGMDAGESIQLAKEVMVKNGCEIEVVGTIDAIKAETGEQQKDVGVVVQTSNPDQCFPELK